MRLIVKEEKAQLTELTIQIEEITIGLEPFKDTEGFEKYKDNLKKEIEKTQQRFPRSRSRSWGDPTSSGTDEETQSKSVTFLDTREGIEENLDQGPQHQNPSQHHNKNGKSETTTHLKQKGGTKTRSQKN